MDIKKLEREFENCPCGKVHTCPIDFVSIGKGVTEDIALVCRSYSSVLVVSDENTFETAGKRVAEYISDRLETSLILKPNGKVVIPNEEKIAEIESHITDKTDFIVGVGSGVINDLCKYVSFKRGLHYAIVATAPSMDGYASVGAALILEGMKVTLNARPPRAIIGDTEVLKTAPLEMLQAGYGDIVGKYSCLCDWRLSAVVNGEHLCTRVYDLTLSTVKRIEGLGEKIVERDSETVGLLFEALVLVGVAMSFTGSSRPASGSEHHLSHFFEITGILEKKEYFSHGIDVLFSSVETEKLRERLIALKPEKRDFSREAWESDIRRIYRSSADGVIALQDKLGWYFDEDKVTGKWEEIKNILSECPPSERFIEMAHSVGLDFGDFERLYGKEKIDDALLYAKDLKDRYSVLWLYYQFFRSV